MKGQKQQEGKIRKGGGVQGIGVQGGVKWD